MQCSVKQLTQWKETRERLGIGQCNAQSSCRKEVRWSAPAGRFKLNIDASVFPGSSSFSVGMILRDHQGTFLQAKDLRCAGEILVFEAEARGVLEALDWLQSLQITNVDLESDSMLTVNALTKGTEYYLELGAVLHDCRVILSSRPDLSICFVKKQAYKVVHLLTRAPFMVGCSNGL